MTQFKVGDRVRFVSEKQFHEGAGASWGEMLPEYTVREVSDQGDFVYLEGAGAFRACGVFSYRLELVPAVPAPKFSVGDRVRFKEYDYFPGNEVGHGHIRGMLDDLYDVKCEATGHSFGRFEYELTAAPGLQTVIIPDAASLSAEEQKNVNYFDKKYDAGKRDYTLLPEHEVTLILDTERVLRDANDWEDCRAESYLACAVGHLLDYRADGCLDDLLEAYVYSCRGQVIESLDGVVQVLEHGAKKYARDSWRTVPDAADRYFSAAMRHLHAISKGEVLDTDSGLHHWDHLRCNLIFMIGVAP